MLALEPRDRAVVDDRAVLVEHEPVAHAPDVELGNVVDVEALEELRRIGAGDLDLAERRGVEDPDAGAHGRGLALHRLMRRLAFLQIAGGPHPAAGFPPVSAERLVFRMRRQQPLHGVPLADLPSGERAERHRRVRRPEGRRADFRGTLGRHRGDGQERIEVAGLALVRRHAAGRVALQELDVFESFGERDLGIGNRDVVQVVEPLAAGLAVFCSRRYRDFRREWRLLHGRARNLQVPGPADLLECVPDRAHRVGETLIERGATIQRADRLQRRARALRAKTAARFVEDDRRARVRPEMDGRLPAAGDAERIAVDVFSGAELHALESLAADRLDDARPGPDFDVLRAQPFGEIRRRFRAAVEQDRDRRARRHEVERGEIGGVVVGCEHDLPSGCDPIAVRVLAHGAGKHDARQVVLLEDERLLDRAGRKQRLLRVHAPVALAHGARLVAEVEPLQQPRHAVVVEAEAGRGRQQGDVPRRGKLAEHAREPGDHGRVIDERVGGEEPAAAFEILLGEHDA